MSEDLTFAEVMNQLRAGDQTAAAQVFRRFAHRLIALARGHLDGRIRAKVDPEDVMQSALKSFFLRHADGQFDLSGWDSLWSLLVVITLRKCGHQVEHFRAACRDLGREQFAAAGDDSAASWQLIAAEPTPSQAAMLAEAVEHLMSALNDQRERQVLALRLQAHSVEEISHQVGRSERTVQRILDRVRKRLERMRDE
jgi:RNA polymerase sigma-70 factor (ECF subfamily)